MRIETLGTARGGRHRSVTSCFVLLVQFGLFYVVIFNNLCSGTLRRRVPCYFACPFAFISAVDVVYTFYTPQAGVAVTFVACDKSNQKHAFGGAGFA